MWSKIGMLTTPVTLFVFLIDKIFGIYNNRLLLALLNIYNSIQSNRYHTFHIGIRFRFGAPNEKSISRHDTKNQFVLLLFYIVVLVAVLYKRNDNDMVNFLLNITNRSYTHTQRHKRYVADW